MPRQRQRMVCVVVAIHVRDLERDFENRCVDGHIGRFVREFCRRAF